MPALADRFHQRVFNALYARSLVYNACWEDPACDREALGLGPGHRVLVITSGGCNALDYLLCEPDRVHAVDANPRQNALLELKVAGIRSLDYDDFWACFGHGRHPGFRDLYRLRLRAQLGDFARRWWDARQHWFAPGGPGSSLYFRGLSGVVANGMRLFINRRSDLRAGVHALLQAEDLDHQRAIYDAEVAPRFWTPGLRWAVSRRTMLSLLGVPHVQTGELARAHDQGVSGFIRASVERVFREMPLWNNYFWQVYLTGSYRPECCPEYLTEANHRRLKSGLVDRLDIHTATVTDCLHAVRQRGEQLTRLVLLDHMDWMGGSRPDLLAEEWAAIFAATAPGARVIFRSAHAEAAYLGAVRIGGGALLERLRFQRELADRLHRQDRVGTYGGFHIADLEGAA